jgi:hypothetical protein
MVSYSAALVALLARAAVHREHRDAGASAARAMRTALRSAAPAGAHLQRHRHVARRAGRDHRLDDRERQRLVLHQRRAGPLVAHLLGRAAHVDVDDLRAAVDVVGARPRPSSRRRCRRSAPRSGGLAVVVGAALVFSCSTGRARGHHLAHRIAGAEALAQLAERPVGHARPSARRTGGSPARCGRCCMGRRGGRLLKKEAAV